MKLLVMQLSPLLLDQSAKKMKNYLSPSEKYCGRKIFLRHIVRDLRISMQKLREFTKTFLLSLRIESTTSQVRNRSRN
jgi:hypothetical protein